MTANHAPGCPAIADPRDGCSCLLRQTSVPGPRNLAPVDPARPASVAPAGEDYGAPIEPPDESVAVFCDTDGDLIPMKRFDDYWYGRDPGDRGTWVQCVAQLGKPIAVHVPGASQIAVAAQGEHDRMCPVYVPMPENQCGYCHLIARVREDERQRVTSDFAEYLRHMEEWQAGYNKGHAAGVEQGQRDEREACIAAVSAPTLHDDACCSNGCTLMHSSEWEATRRIQIALGFPLSEEPPPPYRCDGSCNCTAAAFIAAIRAREEKP